MNLSIRIKFRLVKISLRRQSCAVRDVCYIYCTVVVYRSHNVCNSFRFFFHIVRSMFINKEGCIERNRLCMVRTIKQERNLHLKHFNGLNVSNVTKFQKSLVINRFRLDVYELIEPNLNRKSIVQKMRYIKHVFVQAQHLYIKINASEHIYLS